MIDTNDILIVRRADGDRPAWELASDFADHVRGQRTVRTAWAHRHTGALPKKTADVVVLLAPTTAEWDGQPRRANQVRIGIPHPARWTPAALDELIEDAAHEPPVRIEAECSTAFPGCDRDL